MNKSSILRKKLDYNLHNKNPKICTMKTPIQKLIEELEMMRNESDGHTAEVEAYTKAIDLANYFISEEVDALDEAYSQGVIDEYNFTTTKK